MSAIGTLVFILLGIVLLVTIITQLVGFSAASRSPRKGKTTKLSSGSIHWVESGKGRPILMIHGLGGNLHNFTYALTAELSDSFRVIAIDRPGCGWSDRNGADQATLAEQARLIAEFIETENLGKPLIVGHSLGGAIAEAIALNHPDHISALALICPATAEVEVTPDAFKGIDISVPWLIPVIANTLAGAMSLLMEKKILAQVFAPEPVSPDFLTRGGGILGRRPASFVAAAQDLTMSRASVAQVLGREAEIKIPVGVLYGASDNILAPAVHGKPFAEKTGGTYAELPGSGHMIPLTAPKECAAFIRDMAGKSN